MSVQNPRFINKQLTLAIALCTATTVAQADASRTSLEEVVVTAQKQDEVSQNVPLAITSMDGAALQKSGVTDVVDLSRQVPSLAAAPYPQTSSTTIIFMRGVGTADSEQIARDVGVGIYIDDVYLGRAQGLSTEMVDLERIEVLRGPQGTLYGRNTIGGAVKFVTAKPLGDWGFKQSVDVGNHGRFQSLTTVDTAEVANISAKLSYLKTEVDGLVKNPGTGPDFGEKEADGYRVALRWLPTDDISVDYSYDHSKQDGTSYYAQRETGGPAPYGFVVPLFEKRLGTAFRAVDLPLKDDFKQKGHALTLTWNINDSTTFKSVTAHRKIKSERLHDTVEAYGIPALTQGSTDAGQSSQEFILNGTIADPALDYVVGIFFFNQVANQFANDGLADPFSLAVNIGDPVNEFRAPTLDDLGTGTEAHLHNKSRAVYGNLTWIPPILDDNLSLILGARYSHDDRAISRFFGGVRLDEGDAGYNSFDPSFTIDYAWTASLHTYYRIARAFRSGGFSIRTTTLEPYDKETLIAQELGLKSKWWNERIRLNMAVFKSKYKDIQLDFIDFSDFSTHTINAANATITGAETEFEIIPIDGLRLGVDYTYLDTQKGVVIDPFNQTELQDTALPHTPRHKYNVQAEYTFTPFSFGGVLSGNVGYTWTDDEATEGGPGSALDKAPAHGLLNARLSLNEISVGDRSKLNVALWGKNLENEDYVVYRGTADIYGEKRSYGMYLEFKY